MADLKEIGGLRTPLQLLASSVNESSTKVRPPSDLRSSESADSVQQKLSSTAEEDCGRPEASSTKKDCTMCGDVGIYEELFRCRRCQYRYQHIYCSRSYPELGSEMCVCNWCLHEEDKAKEFTEPKQVKVKKKPQDIVDHRNNAFNFLLQIAQSLPENGEPEEKIQFVPREIDISSNTQVPKRQRCSPIAEKSRVIASDKWRQIAKNRSLQINPPRGIGRRYKLLADVLC